MGVDTSVAVDVAGCLPESKCVTNGMSTGV